MAAVVAAVAEAVRAAPDPVDAGVDDDGPGTEHPATISVVTTPTTSHSRAMTAG